MGEKIKELKGKLKSIGLSDEVVTAAWPKWWSDDAERSPSALNDLKFSVARRLGITPSSLFDEGNATFVWQGDAKFKGFSAKSNAERTALNAFGSSVARSLLIGQEESRIDIEFLGDANNIRASILNMGAPFIQLIDLVALSWTLRIPVIHLRVSPLAAKRIAAMTVRSGDSYAILLSRDSVYPSRLAFILAHELGHIARNHLPRDTSLIDRSVIGDRLSKSNDSEEVEADQFALALLTGRSESIIEFTRPAKTSTELASSVLNASKSVRVEPGILALCYGYETGSWRIAQGALKILHKNTAQLWQQVNRAALQSLNWDAMPQDSSEFIQAILGLP